MIIIQNASAGKAERYPNITDPNWKLNDPEWETVAEGDDYKEAFERFIFELNSESVNIENGWIRVFDTETKTFLNEQQ